MSDWNDIDLCFARLRQNIEKNQDKDENKEDMDAFLTQIMTEINKAERLSLSPQTMFDGLFDMLLPFEVSKEPINEGNVVLFQSQEDHMTLAVKVINSGLVKDMDDLKIEYIRLMKQSKQHTKVVLSGSSNQGIGMVYYFSAVHSMPEEGLCDFIVLFQIEEKTVIMDFSYPQKDSFLWEKVIKAILPTIHKREREVSDGN